MNYVCVTLCKYEGKNGDLFLRADLRCYTASVSVASDVLIESAVIYQYVYFPGA